jgi:signal peptidase I
LKLLVAAAAVVVGVLGVLVVLRRRYLNVVVRGVSMAPTYTPGDELLLDRRARGGPRRGVVVVIRMRHDGPGEVVAPGVAAGEQLVLKRVIAVAGDPVPEDVPGEGAVPPGQIVLRGDGRHSLDSRIWGCVPADRVVGVVLRKLSAQTVSSSG